ARLHRRRYIAAGLLDGSHTVLHALNAAFLAAALDAQAGVILARLLHGAPGELPGCQRIHGDCSIDALAQALLGARANLARRLLACALDVDGRFERDDEALDRVGTFGLIVIFA